MSPPGTPKATVGPYLLSKNGVNIVIGSETVTLYFNDTVNLLNQKKKLSNNGMNFKSIVVGNNTKALRKKQQQQVSKRKLLKRKSRSVSSSSRNLSIW